MGRHWYEDEGKYTTKMNTFVDFGTAAEFLIAKGVTTSERLGVVGRSAGRCSRIWCHCIVMLKTAI